jgi:hypothetical protein
MEKGEGKGAGKKEVNVKVLYSCISNYGKDKNKERC